MATASVTYTFVNGNTADASQVNQNFTDLINSTSDGTKTFELAKLGIGRTAATYNLEVEGSSLINSTTTSGVALLVKSTDNSNTGSEAQLLLSTGGSSGGDPYVKFEVSSANTFVMGVDNSDSDKFKISDSSFGSSDWLTIDTTGAAVFNNKVTVSSLAASGRVVGSNGGTSGSPESVDVGGKTMVILSPSGGGDRYYNFTNKVDGQIFFIVKNGSDNAIIDTGATDQLYISTGDNNGVAIWDETADGYISSMDSWNT